MTPVEQWNRAYTEAPEIFDAFTRAEDPEDRVVNRLLRHAALAGSAVLEIGCGTGRYTARLAPHAGLYLGLERSPPMLALARRALARPAPRTRLVCGLAERLPLADASVDHAIAAWVVVNLRPAVQRAALGELQRVLRGDGGGVWLLENHWESEFQELRGRRAAVERARVERLVEAGFRLLERVETELRFPSPEQARRVLGYLCGERVAHRLRERPRAVVAHDVIILHRPAGA